MKALAFACLLVSLLLAAPAQAAWPGKDGAIAFSRGTHIWVEQPNGRQRQLTSGPVIDAGPSYSRDGELIAFVRFSENNSDIWVMNSDGTEQRPVTETGDWELESDPAFFPSGRSLVFTATTRAGGWKVYSIGIDGTGLRLLAERAKAPVVSPNGRLLAFWRPQTGNRIWIKDLRTGEERWLPSGRAQEPDFSPDGKRLVFVAQRQCGERGARRLMLMTMGLRDSRPRVLHSTCRRNFITYSPVWSPRGNRIVFVRRDNPGGRASSRLQMLNLRGELVPGAPRHRPGTLDFSPSWQPR